MACRFQIWTLFASYEVEQEVWFIFVVEEVWVVVDLSQGWFVVVMVEDWEGLEREVEKWLDWGWVEKEWREVALVDI